MNLKVNWFGQKYHERNRIIENSLNPEWRLRLMKHDHVQKFMSPKKWQCFQNLSGTIVSIISIISLAMSPNPRTAAIYYFITALFILLACFDTYFALPLNVRFFSSSCSFGHLSIFYWWLWVPKMTFDISAIFPVPWSHVQQSSSREKTALRGNCPCNALRIDL